MPCGCRLGTERITWLDYLIDAADGVGNLV
jgi:hypothetical protein